MGQMICKMSTIGSQDSAKKERSRLGMQVPCCSFQVPELARDDYDQACDARLRVEDHRPEQRKPPLSYSPHSNIADRLQPRRQMASGQSSLAKLQNP
jgi:hypothetical protein